jgi:hypothetical protein
MKLIAGDLPSFPGQRIPDQFLTRKSQTKGEKATTTQVSGQISIRIFLTQFTTENIMSPILHKNFPRVAGESRTRFVEGRSQQHASMGTVFNHSEVSHKTAELCPLHRRPEDEIGA